MKKLLFVFVLLLSFTTLVAQEIPNSIKRYDLKEVGKFQYDEYTVMVITDCITNEKEFKLRVSYRVEFDNGNKETKVLYLSDGVVAEMIKAFSYLYTTEFEPKLEGEESFIIYEISDGLFFKYRINPRRLEVLIDDSQVMPSIYDVFDDDADDIYNEIKAKNRQHVLAHIDIDYEYEMKAFGDLLQKIEKAFAEKGRNLKDAVNENKTEPQKL